MIKPNVQVGFVDILRDNPNIDICLEIPESMWCDDFQNYQVRDLCSGGKLFENPDILDCSDWIKDNIRKGHYSITPRSSKALKEKHSILTGYINVIDTEDGMRVAFTYRDVRK